MKRTAYIFIASAVIAASGACTKGLDCPDVDFDVVAETVEVKAGEAVTFNMSGHTDYLTFWSGEVGSDYEYRNGREIVPGWEYLISFNSKWVKGDQEDQLSLYVSNSFDGNYSDYDNILHSDWTDITDRFDWAYSGAATPSTEQPLTEFIEEGRPLFLAFRYKTMPQTENGTAANWLISDFRIMNVTDEYGQVTKYDNADSGFRVVDPFARTEFAANSTVSATQIALAGYDNESVTEEMETDCWVISRPLDMSSSWNAGPDTPEPLKNFSQKDLTVFSYVYDEPGVYDATFIASNLTIRDKKERVKTIRIIVNE